MKNTVVFFQHAGSVSWMQNVEAKPQTTASIRTKNEKVRFQGLVEVAAAESPTDTLSYIWQLDLVLELQSVNQ